ncbi:MAG: hypothetical protein ABDH16_02315 [Thermodesulfovibrionaceae bacterium]
MKIKNFQGKSFKEVLETVKKEMGPEAVIISTTTKKDSTLGHLIEVTAALDEPEDNFVFSDGHKDLKVFLEIEKIKEELKFLRETVTKFFPSLYDKSKSSLYNLLIKCGVEPHLALHLTDNSDSIEKLKEMMKKEIKFNSKSFDEEEGFIFYGFPGVGKTTTIYKIGQLLRNKDKKFMILSLDSRISSVAYIKDIAIRLRCEAKILRDVREFYKTVHKEVEKTKLLIDTAGDISAEVTYQLKEILKDIPIKKCYLIDASVSAHSNLKLLQSIDQLSIDCIGFSKIDLASNYGNLYNLSVLSGKPVSFLTSGSFTAQKKDIYLPNYIVNLILGGACEA